MKKVVLLVGQVGTGKTTLFNKITNSNQIVKYGGRGVTHEVSVKNSSYEYGFTLIDTPGLDGGDDIGTVPAYFNIFEKIEISRIMVVACYVRLSLIIDSCKKIIQAFEKYKDRITIVITRFDQFDEKVREQDYLIQNFQKVGIKSIIFASKQDSGETLCKLFDSEIKDSQPQKIQPTEVELLSFQNGLDEELRFEFLGLQENLAYQSRNFLKSLRVMNQNDQNTVLIAKEIIKKLINKNYDEFNRLVGSKGNDEQQFLLFEELKRSIIDTLDENIDVVKQNKIELENFTQNEMKAYYKNYEADRQKCLQKIREDAKKQKINYL